MRPHDGISRKAAKAAGLKKYSTGNPCPNGHVGERYTSTGSCAQCISAHTRRQVDRGYFKTHYDANREAILVRCRAAHFRDRDRRNIEAKAWAKANPEKRRIISMSYKARRRAQEKDGISTAALRTWIGQQKKVCYWCGTKCGRRFQIDHYAPLSKGGRHAADNLVISCRPCNLRKNAKDPLRFAAEMGRLL